MNHPAPAEPGPRPDEKNSNPVPSAPAGQSTQAAGDTGSRDPVGDDGDCEMPDEQHARYEPL